MMLEYKISGNNTVLFYFYTAFTVHFLIYIKYKFQQIHYIYGHTLSHHVTSYHPACFDVNPSSSGVHFYHCLHKIKRCTMNDSLQNICSLSDSDVTVQV
jgi:hypothetical protein